MHTTVTLLADIASILLTILLSYLKYSATFFSRCFIFSLYSIKIFHFLFYFRNYWSLCEEKFFGESIYIILSPFEFIYNNKCRMNQHTSILFYPHFVYIQGKKREKCIARQNWYEGRRMYVENRFEGKINKKSAEKEDNGSFDYRSFEYYLFLSSWSTSTTSSSGSGNLPRLFI